MSSTLDIAGSMRQLRVVTRASREVLGRQAANSWGRCRTGPSIGSDGRAPSWWSRAEVERSRPHRSRSRPRTRHVDGGSGAARGRCRSRAHPWSSGPAAHSIPPRGPRHRRRGRAGRHVAPEERGRRGRKEHEQDDRADSGEEHPDDNLRRREESEGDRETSEHEPDDRHGDRGARPVDGSQEPPELDRPGRIGLIRDDAPKLLADAADHAKRLSLPVIAAA